MEGYVKGTTGAYNRIGFQGSVNVPFSETIKARISAKYHKRDGYVDRLWLEMT